VRGLKQQLSHCHASIGKTHKQGGNAMPKPQPVSDAFDLQSMGVNEQRLDFARRQRVAAFLADSACYLGLAHADAQGCCLHAAPLIEQAQLTAGVAGC